jgi:hypothetical protein
MYFYFLLAQIQLPTHRAKVSREICQWIRVFERSRAFFFNNAHANIMPSQRIANTMMPVTDAAGV